MLKVPKPFASRSGASGGSATTGSGASRHPAAPPGPGASHQMAMEARAHLALIHAQWTPSGKRHISHLILQCFGVVFFCMRKRKKKKNETDFCFLFFSLGKGLLFIDTDTGFETPATTKRVFIRAEKNKSQKKAECGVLQRLKTSDGGELGCRRTGTSLISGSSWCWAWHFWQEGSLGSLLLGPGLMAARHVSHSLKVAG